MTQAILTVAAVMAVLLYAFELTMRYQNSLAQVSGF